MKRPPLIPSLIVLAFVILMTNLGFWQLNRAQEKEELLLLLSDDNIVHVKEPSQIKNLPQYANVKISGKFLDTPQLLLDNQIDNQIVGYHVFTPFLVDKINVFLMINRGWIAKNDYKNHSLSVSSETITIEGKLNHSPQVGIQLGEIELEKNKSTQVITYFDRLKVSSFLHESLCNDLNCIVSPRVLLLEKNQTQGFKREWNPIIMPPAKHMGYAVQWFSMTVVLILIFIYWVSKLED